MNMKLSWALIPILFILLIGCQAAPVIETETSPITFSGEADATPQPVEPTPPDQPKTGKATVTGQVFSHKTSTPLINTVVRLAEVHRQGDEGAYLLDTAFSPGDITDEQGYFVFENIEPGEYVMVVGNVEAYNEYVIIPEPSGLPLVYNIEVDKIQDIGELIVDLEPTS
jgi:hypothetical protein